MTAQRERVFARNRIAAASAVGVAFLLLAASLAVLGRAQPPRPRHR